MYKVGVVATTLLLRVRCCVMKLVAILTLFQIGTMPMETVDGTNMMSYMDHDRILVEATTMMYSHNRIILINYVTLEEAGLVVVILTLTGHKSRQVDGVLGVVLLS